MPLTVPPRLLAIALLALTSTLAQDRTLLFDTSGTGVSKPITEWGADTAWPDRANMVRSIAFMGIGEIDLVRATFPMNAALTNGQLTTAQLADIANRVQLANLAGANKPLTLTADTGAGVDPWFKSGTQVIPVRWVETITAAVRAYRGHGKTISVISPFNEPDYGWDQGTTGNLFDILGLLAAHPEYTGITYAGGSTLNCDSALAWYNPIRSRISEGTTHQLAGSFDTYAAFYQTVVANGHKAVNEELHNVGEAIVGAEYGVTSGTWWAAAERTRGHFVRANQGQRLAYAEHRPNWTAAAVYRGPDTRVRAFVGSSERQAVTTSFRFVTRDRKVFFDGQGPAYSHTVVMPGGTGYWTGQTNAETMVNLTWGEDAPPAVAGRYQIINRGSLRALQFANASTSDGAVARQATPNGALAQLWDVYPVDTRIGGDFAYHSVRAAHSGKSLDVLNWSLNAGGSLIQWAAGDGANQQWFLDYAGNGWFHIRSRWSGLYLSVVNASAGDGATVYQWSATGGAEQQWRLLPAGAAADLRSPAAPGSLIASPAALSVHLSWAPVAAADLAGYSIYRSTTSATGPFELIARDLTNTIFVDETARSPVPHYYRIRATDRSLNQSIASPTVTATPTGGETLVARYAFEGDLLDIGEHANHLLPAAVTPSYAVGRVGSQAFAFDGTSRHLDLAPGQLNHDRFTFAAWVYWNGGNAWQRIFDFGNGTDHYLFLTPRASSAGLRFAIKNGGAEQQLNAPVLPTGQWTHVAIALGSADARLYVNGVQVAASAAITLKPSDFNPALNYLGKSQWPDPLFAGRLDDVRLYNHALTATQVATLAAGPLPAPSGLTLTPGPQEIRLSWSSVPQAESYAISYATSPDGPYLTLASGLASPAFTHAGLSYGTTYHYQIEATNFGDTSPPSAYLAATPESALISNSELDALQVNLSVTAAGDTVARLRHPATIPGHYYHLQTAADLAGPWTDLTPQWSGDGQPLDATAAPQPASPRRFYRGVISR